KLTLQVNQASGAAPDGSLAAALDWTKALDLDRDARFGEAQDDRVTPAGNPLDLDGALLQASGVATVDIFGFVSGSVGFSFSQQTVDVDVDGDGTITTGAGWNPPVRGPPGPDLEDATLTTIGLTVEDV